MTLRAVSDTVLHPNGTPYVNTTIRFVLRQGSYSASAAYTGGDPSGNVTAITNASGGYTVNLWANAEGLAPSTYLVAYPGETFEIIIPAGTGGISMAALRTTVTNWVPATVQTAIDVHRAELANTTTTGLGDGLVGYRSAGTGAVGRTVHSRLADLAVAVEDFGAVGDGVVDDSASFQLAINALAAVGGGILRLAARRYAAHTRPELADTVYLVGAGIGATILDFSGATDTAFNAAGTVDQQSCIAAVGAAPTALPALVGAIALHATTLTFVSSVSALLVPGDVIMVHNPTDYSFNFHRPQYRAGEMLIVLSVAGAVVTLAVPTAASYATGTANAYRLNLIRAGISGMSIRCKTKASGTDPLGIYFKYCTGLLTHDLEINGTNWAHILTVGCHAITLGCRTRYYTASIGLNYGINVGNSQDVTLLEECNIAVGRHAVSFGGSDALGVPCRDLRIMGGSYAGIGGASVGAIGYHGNCDRWKIVGSRIENGITVNGSNGEIQSTYIKTGINPVALGSSEFHDANLTISDVQIAVRAEPLGASGSAVGVINLILQPDCGSGVISLNDVRIDMGGHSGIPLRIYHNGAVGDIDVNATGLTVHNVNPAAVSCQSVIEAIAGAKYRTVTFDGALLDKSELRLEKAGARLAQFKHVHANNPIGNGILVLPPGTSQAITLLKSQVAGVLTRLLLSYDDDGNLITESQEFTLAAANDALYLGYPLPFSSVTLAFDILVNNNIATLTWEYWNGTTWAALAGVVDGTVIAGAPLAQNGVVSYTLSLDWAKVRLGLDSRGATRLYWVRGRTSAALDTVRLATAGNLIGLTSPVTEETISVDDCHIHGAGNAGLLITGASQLFTLVRIANSRLNNNGKNPLGSSSQKSSYYVTTALLLEAANNWVGDTRAPSGTSEAQTRVYRVDNVTDFYEHDQINVNPTALTTITLTNVTNERGSMDRGTYETGWAAAAPTTGTWRAGTRLRATTTRTAQKNIRAWECITAGTPGTWRADGEGRGTTAQRPTLLTGDAGFRFWDVTLLKEIHWSGSAWDV